MLAEAFRIGFSLGIVLYLIAYEDLNIDVYKSITIGMTIGFVLTMFLAISNQIIVNTVQWVNNAFIITYLVHYVKSRMLQERKDKNKQG